MCIARFVLVTCSAVLAAACVQSAPPAAPVAATDPAPVQAPVAAADRGAASAVVYGRVTEGPRVTPSQVLAQIDAYRGQHVRLEGTATAVCQRRGCWMDVADETASIRIKVRDGEVVFPMAARGRKVVAEGTIVEIPADPAQDAASCGKHADGETHHDCARPQGAKARLDGVGAVVFEGA